MASQQPIPQATTPAPTAPAVISIPPGFNIQPADSNLEPPPTKQPLIAPAPGITPLKPTPQAPLGVLSSFTGTFAGSGFNLIFRPNSGQTTFPNPVDPPPPTPPSENVLELNLTAETLTFSNPLGDVPNRGLEQQVDITLNGVPYVQAINDVTNIETGKADGKPIGIHFEPGLWMHVPATTTDPNIAESLVRMASIPHGTTINAQCLAPTATIQGLPNIASVDPTPFVIATGRKIPFISQTATNVNTPRLPQDLTNFIAAGTITQDILTDPNTVLRNANKGKNITSFSVFKVKTQPDTPLFGGGTDNIAFLEGAGATINAQPNANANAVQMEATFWIETVQHKIFVPVWKPGQPPIKIQPDPAHPGARVPTFLVHPPHEITTPRPIIVNSTQIQYSQTVNLNFAGLTWPHISVATLVPTTPVSVPHTVWQ
jgi:hypothetical protein